MTTRTITGPGYEPDVTGLDQATIRFIALRNNYSTSHPVYRGTISSITTTVAGAFSVALGLGDYRCEMQENGATPWIALGDIAVTAGSSVTLGELIEETRDLSLDLTLTADWVTYDEMVAYVDGGGGSVGDLPITSLGLGTAIARDNIEVNKGGTAIIGTRHLGMSLTFGLM